MSPSAAIQLVSFVRNPEEQDAGERAERASSILSWGLLIDPLLLIR